MKTLSHPDSIFKFGKEKSSKLKDIKFLIHSNRMTERGDSADMISMSRNLKQFLNIESILCFPLDQNGHRNNSEVVKESSDAGFFMYQYTKREELEKFAYSEGITHVYAISEGTKSGVNYVDDKNPNPIIPGTKHITRAVFRNFEPHGDLYLYVSKWLFKKATKKINAVEQFKHGETLVSWMPQIIEPIQGSGDAFRTEFNIPLDVKIIGRIGAYDQFTDTVAQKALIRILNQNSDVFVVTVNTKKFYDHRRLISLPYLPRKKVWDFYDACDVLLNGRLMGESFGFSIVEPLSLGKPILAPHWIRNPLMDKHHIYLLDPLNLIYFSETDLVRKLLKQLYSPIRPVDLKELVSDFSAKKVMERFSNFLSLI